MTSIGFGFEGVALELGDALGRTESKLELDTVLQYFAELGISFPSVLTEIPAIQTALGSARDAARLAGTSAASLRSSIDGGSSSAAVTALALTSATNSVSALSNLSGLGNVLIDNASSIGLPTTRIAEFASSLARRIVDRELVAWLETNARSLITLLAFLGVVRRVKHGSDPADASKPRYVERALNLELLGRAITDPLSGLSDVYGFNLADFGNPLADPERNGTSFLAAIGGALDIQVPYSSLETTSGLPELDADVAHFFIDSSSAPGTLCASINVEVPDGLQLETQLSSAWAVSVHSDGLWPFGSVFRADAQGNLLIDAAPGEEFAGRIVLGLSAKPVGTSPILLFGQPKGTRLELKGATIEYGLQFKPSSEAGISVASPEVRLSTSGGLAAIDVTDGDGFIKSLIGSGKLQGAFDAAATYTFRRGVAFEAGGGLKIVIPVHSSIGGISFESLALSVPIEPGSSGIPLALGATIRGQLGPIEVTLADVGFSTTLTFPNSGGNLGLLDVDFGFEFPSGVGIKIDAGGVSGGGFLSRDKNLGRYAGAIELKVFSISVKAFGLLDTKMPDGTGYSFVIVIVAEFTPIQLGFGFTLIGVGGLLGINRSVNSDALSAAVRTGSLEHVLFPHDVVANAPAIINDLASIFPAANGHYIFGPMGKLGWGTPTLITADLGILLEFPGPRLGLVGVLRMQLPKPDAALLSLQMAVGGLLDFPAKTTSIDASIYDSNVVGMPITGDMAFRIHYGSNPTFLFSVGGFNPGFKAPPAFPKLNPCAVDLGVHGNPSLVASGYFALTSNSAQFGAGLDLRAHGAGIDLHGWLTFDALFIFSPFSFSAGISAGVRVSFHGVGLGVSLGGTLSGPSPWHFAGRACVSVLWWDACLPVDITFGSKTPAAVQEVDPWTGTPQGTDSRVQVTGLFDAVTDTRNWSGSAPPEGYTVVSLAADNSGANPPIDPLGPATLHQKVCPLNKTLEKFGEYKPKDHTRFDFSFAKVNGGDKITDVDYVKDQFVPGHFLNLPNDKKLSRDSYEEMTSGITLSPNAVTLGSTGSRKLDYETVLINDEGERTKLDGPFNISDLELQAILGRCASALGGIRRTGNNKYMLPGRPKLVTVINQKYVVTDPCTRKVNLSITPTPVPRSEAEQALLDWEADTQNAEQVGRYVVLPKAA